MKGKIVISIRLRSDCLFVNGLLLLLVFQLFQSCGSSDSVFELSPQQSMSITGKGPGQDAARNPYGDSKSVAVVKNIGEAPFVVRIQEKDALIMEEELKGSERKEFLLEKGYQLYLDSQEMAKAKVNFKKFN
ncbi:hypothetical protein [Robertkochia aurantiaca]|uniref:hypothetical protein n=1 Tax=Robertkochia aurantiaca TaxID=2873700 RepID=UPI001CCEF030|nr:hypothetical protein [Robertkochia sp. 3YJGBD-33]